jgi:hypothetical protein
MVEGLDKFKEYFKDFTNSYVIIGGTACDIIIGAAGLTPRRTKDIDIILIVEALNPEFVSHFWSFIKEAGYEQREKSSEDRKYYRFLKPADPGFPYQVELFSRKPDALDLKGEPHLTPIPVDDDLSSLSAILLNDEYYQFTISHSILEEGLHRANTEALICLKAKAFLDMHARKEKGEELDEKHIRKHKTDVFRLVLLLTPETVLDLPGTIKTDMQEFVNTVKDNLPAQSIFKEMGVANIDAIALLHQLVNNFTLKLKV